MTLLSFHRNEQSEPGDSAIEGLEGSAVVEETDEGLQGSAAVEESASAQEAPAKDKTKKKATKKNKSKERKQVGQVDNGAKGPRFRFPTLRADGDDSSHEESVVETKVRSFCVVVVCTNNRDSQGRKRKHSGDEDDNPRPKKVMKYIIIAL